MSGQNTVFQSPTDPLLSLLSLSVAQLGSHVTVYFPWGLPHTLGDFSYGRKNVKQDYECKSSADAEETKTLSLSSRRSCEVGDSLGPGSDIRVIRSVMGEGCWSGLRTPKTYARC